MTADEIETVEDVELKARLDESKVIYECKIKIDDLEHKLFRFCQFLEPQLRDLGAKHTADALTVILRKLETQKELMHSEMDTICKELSRRRRTPKKAPPAAVTEVTS